MQLFCGTSDWNVEVNRSKMSYGNADISTNQQNQRVTASKHFSGLS